MIPNSIEPDQEINAFDNCSWRSSLEVDAQKQIADLRILIVDDNWFARSLLRNVLQALGIWKLVECPYPKEGLKRLQEEHFDLVLTDNHMPKMSGVEFTRQIRAGDRVKYPAIPIVMISSLTELGNVNKAADAGIHEFLAKPFTADGLVKKILSSINTPRQFIRSTTYVGPCRRRQKLVLKSRGKDRRMRSAGHLAA